LIRVNLSGLLTSVNAKRASTRDAADADKTPPAIELRAALAENLRRYRQAADLTQKQLGALANVSRDYISQIESGDANVSIDVLNVLAIHLQTTPIALLTKTR
jgi:DNA-binding XRE family transcriptional regulator